MNCKAVDKTLEQCFWKEFKVACKNSVESELNKQTQSEMYLVWFCSQPFNLFKEYKLYELCKIVADERLIQLSTT